jgi:tetratricopeptide (TPR) repeat protein
MKYRGLAVLGIALGLTGVAEAKFGMSKTRVMLPRVRPPVNALLAETVYLDVRSESPEVTGSHVSIVKGRVEDALRGSDMYRLLDRERGADATLRVSLSSLRAEVRDEVRMETKYVKIGERQEWNDKKKKMETKDVYGNRSEPENWRVADGSLSATVVVQGGGGDRTTDVGGSYHKQFKMEGGLPPEASTEESLKRYLVTATADNVVGQITFAPDPVEALLAVNDELKAGNKLAEAGLYQEALEEWSRRTFKGDTEAARLHNLGVAHEAIAYKMPPFTPEHRGHLTEAKELYLKALQLDSDEKYFREPPPRVDQSLAYAATATLFMQELADFREEKSPARPAPRPASKPATTQAPKATTVAAVKPAVGGTPLRNGSFESSLAPWTVTGKGRVAQESGRGNVLEAAASGAPVATAQTVDVGIGAGAAPLSLEYKVVSGEAVIRVQVSYSDATGKARTSNLEVTGGEGPGGWSPWSQDLASLRPKPAKITEIRVNAEGGVVRFDNVAISPR